jgi:hypothetical protein
VRAQAANPRDANQDALIAVAERLGCNWLQAPPLDGWCWVRGRWMPVEIKRPEREGQLFEYTPAQRRFFRWCELRGALWWVWRTESDVIRDLGGRISA